MNLEELKLGTLTEAKGHKNCLDLELRLKYRLTFNSKPVRVSAQNKIAANIGQEITLLVMDNKTLILAGKNGALKKVLLPKLTTIEIL